MNARNDQQFNLRRRLFHFDWNCSCICLKKKSIIYICCPHSQFESHFTSVCRRHNMKNTFSMKSKRSIFQFHLSEKIWLKICNISNDKKQKTSYSHCNFKLKLYDSMSNATIGVSVGFKQDFNSLAMLSDCNRYAIFDLIFTAEKPCDWLKPIFFLFACFN